MTQMAEWVLAQFDTDEKSLRRNLDRADRDGWGAYLVHMLADLESKREIVKLYEHAVIRSRTRSAGAAEYREVFVLSDVLRCLATTYVDREGYRDGW
jgi:hypothetical protein